MRRPCWHFLQAGHSLTSSMQHPPSPDPTPLSALHAGPRIVGPAHPGELSAAQVPACRELALGVLQGRQHEQVAALVIAVVLPPDALERLFERREVAHGRASVWPDV